MPDVNRLIGYDRLILLGIICGNGGFEPIFIIALREFWFKVGAAKFIAQKSPFRNDQGEFQHGFELMCECIRLIECESLIIQSNMLISLAQFFDFIQRLCQIGIVPFHSDIANHPIGQLFVQLVDIFRTTTSHQVFPNRLFLHRGVLKDPLWGCVAARGEHAEVASHL